MADQLQGNGGGGALSKRLSLEPNDLRPRASSLPPFTSQQIAHALRISRPRAWQLIGGAAANDRTIVNGKTVPAWQFDELPAALRERLEREASRCGYRNAIALLQSPLRRWSPPVPLNQIPSRYWQHAEKLRAALADTLRRLNDDTLSPGELSRLGLADFQRVHGRAITARHWQRLLDRVIERDGGAEDWGRLELYLDDGLTRPAQPAAAALAAESVTAPLRHVVDTFKERTAPTPSETARLWDAGFTLLENLTADGMRPAKIRRWVVGFLQSQPFMLAKNRAALGKCWQRKYRAWKDSGRSVTGIADGRAKNSGRKAPPVPHEFLDLLVARGLNTGEAGLTGAWKELWDEEKIPAVFVEMYRRDRLPDCIRSIAGPELERVRLEYLGPKAAKLGGAKCVRTWDGLPAGVQAQADDCTLPVYFYVETAPGEFEVLRGQLLLWIDTRTRYIYHFQLLPKKSYSSLDIMRGIIELHDIYGLPEEFYFERGIWEKSLLIKGRGGDEVSWSDRAEGLASLGIKISHAQGPSAKIVEGVLGAVQNLMERERGYCGRDERRDCPEFVRAGINYWKAGGHPKTYFYSFTEWQQRLVWIFNRYNETPQQGKQLRGLSPRAGLLKWTKSPPIELNNATRYLLATHRRTLTVTAQGVTVRIGKRPYVYRSEVTGRLRGEQVVAWFDIEDPSLITLTDLQHGNPQTVPRCTELPAYGATSEQIAASQSEVAAHRNPSRTHLRRLRELHSEEFAHRSTRQVIATPATRELGETIQRQRTEILRTQISEDNQRRAAARRLQSFLDVKAPGDRFEVTEK
ncbi:MAG: hypothetical protein PCFJNLEI_00322 [Verrucomicrobiae bacterium]|nr:hypothetical protein [Verrucomicrobiae bacterium]